MTDLRDSIPSTPPAHEAPSLPRLHPIYLPFKTQHNILVPVQSLLEECCLDFGKTWVPNLMEAQKWHETGSLELTKWTQRFSKYAKSLPSSAINLEAGKSIARVLFGTSPIRHTAVHRLPTSAAGIMNMLTAAITFAETLNDPKRAKIIAEIKSQLEASIEEIAQHQVLLERKLTDRLEDIARRRAELDELERLSIEEMLGTDKMQRTRVGSALERVLVNSILVNPLHVSNACSCQSQNLDEPKSDSEPTESTEKGMFPCTPLFSPIPISMSHFPYRSQPESLRRGTKGSSPCLGFTLERTILPKRRFTEKRPTWTR